VATFALHPSNVYDMAHSTKSHKLVKETDGQALSVVGDSYRLVLTGKDTGGAFAVIDMMIPPGGGPGPHAHPNFEETFYVLDGEIELTTEEATFTARKGDFVTIPTGGMVHFFKNKSDDIARLWCVAVPAGLEELFLEIGRPAKFGQFLPPPPMNANAMKKLEAVAERHDQQIFPPDYLDKKGGK
jgi:quercetin dioxygenase-like cupin family protein